MKTAENICVCRIRTFFTESNLSWKMQLCPWQKKTKKKQIVNENISYNFSLKLVVVIRETLFGENENFIHNKYFIAWNFGVAIPLYLYHTNCLMQDLRQLQCISFACSHRQAISSWALFFFLVSWMCHDRWWGLLMVQFAIVQFALVQVVMVQLNDVLLLWCRYDMIYCWNVISLDPGIVRRSMD